MIGVDAKGNVAMLFNSTGMYRGMMDKDGKPFASIYR
jgi:isoaspartyl peptidase/L-asparaginase-like protein (Ntn-hydrolase superfamily)